MEQVSLVDSLDYSLDENSLDDDLDESFLGDILAYARTLFKFVDFLLVLRTTAH